MTTGKNHSFDYKDFCRLSNVSAFFNTLSRFTITVLQRSKLFLISWLQSPSTVILEPKKIKSVTVSIPPTLLFASFGWVETWRKLPKQGNPQVQFSSVAQLCPTL